MSLTVVVTNYRRPENVAAVIAALSTQTVKPTIFVWDNSPAQDFDHPGVDWIIRSSRNARCSARWWMASHASTDFVLVHDDDLAAGNPRVLALTLDAAQNTAPFAVGAAGVALGAGKGYWRSQHVGVRARAVRRDTGVDIVKGCFFCSTSRELSRLGHLELDAEDDIAVSAMLARGRSRPHVVAAKLRDALVLLPDVEGARKRRRGHRAARELACRKFFRRV
jgi:hypothetical protein